jgi:hypothetical protein
MRKGQKQYQGMKPKLKSLSPRDSPISITGKSPYGQVNFLLDLDPYNQDRKVINLVTDIPLNLDKLIYREEEEDVPFYDVFPRLVPS